MRFILSKINNHDIIQTKSNAQYQSGSCHDWEWLDYKTIGTTLSYNSMSFRYNKGTLFKDQYKNTIYIENRKKYSRILKRVENLPCSEWK